MEDYLKLSDLDLIEKVKAGNTNAFKWIVERYQDQIAGTIMGMIGDIDIADEIGQTVFIRFFRSISNFKGQSNLGTYLTRIAINLSLNELKRIQRNRSRFAPVSDLWNQSKTQNFENAFVAKELVDKALLDLKPNQKAVIVLRMIQGHSTQSTAEILNIPPGTVLSRLKRAMDNLKLILETKYNYE